MSFLNEIFIAIVTINEDSAKKKQIQISENLKIPVESINIKLFEIENEPSKKDSAISKSHQDVIREGYEKNYKYVMMFEDDASFYKNNGENAEIFRKAWKQKDMIKDWEILFLGSFNMGINCPYSKNISKTFLPFGCHGYILNEKGIKKALGMTFDKYINIPFLNITLFQIDLQYAWLFKSYRIDPCLVYQDFYPRAISLLSHIVPGRGTSYLQELIDRYATITIIIGVIIFLLILYIIIKKIKK